MKVFTQRLGQFAVSALICTVAFRYALNLAIGKESLAAALGCSIIYFGLMYLAGWYIGLRYHFITYLLCIALGYASYYICWNTETIKSMNIGAIAWGIGLAIHFVFFLLAQKNAIRGYAKEEIFQ